MRWRDSSTSSHPPEPQETGFSSPSHMRTCFIVYCISAGMTRERAEGQFLLGSPASVRLYYQVPTPCGNSPAHLFSRKNYLPKVHARAADFSWPGRTPVRPPPKIYLFYRGRVYSRLAMYGFAELPRRRKMVYCPIWALIDTDMKNEEPPIPSSPVIWPVQAISPRPALWKAWSKQTGACLLGMPLWDIEELVKGYVFSLLSPSVIDLGHVTR